MKYNNYDHLNFDNIFSELQNKNVGYKDLSKKYKIPISTLRNRYNTYRLKQVKNKDTIIQKQKDGLEFMENMRGGRNNNKMEDFINENCSKKKQIKKDPEYKMVDGKKLKYFDDSCLDYVK